MISLANKTLEKPRKAPVKKKAVNKSTAEKVAKIADKPVKAAKKVVAKKKKPVQNERAFLFVI